MSKVPVIRIAFVNGAYVPAGSVPGLEEAMTMDKFDDLLEKVNAASTASGQAGQLVGSCYTAMAELGLEMHRFEMNGAPSPQTSLKIALALMAIRRAILLLDLEDEVEAAMGEVAKDYHRRLLAGEDLQ